MKKFVIQVIALLIVIFGTLFLVQNPKYMPQFIRGTSDNKVTLGGETPVIGDVKYLRIKNNQIKVEVADSREKRAKGLGERDALALNDGMLFVFDKPGQYKFWMKGLKFPLDIIWIRGNTIVDVLKYIPAPLPNEEDASLPVYAPVTEVDKVLEVNAGYVDAHSIKIGDKIEFLTKE
jgi:hypothetical protein